MEWLDKGIVLSIRPFRETDVIVRLLTQDHGVISTFAFGGSKSRKRFCGCLDVLNELKIRVQTSVNGKFLHLQETVLLNIPEKIRTDRGMFGILINCIRFIEVIGTTPDTALQVYNVFKNLVYSIKTSMSNYTLIPILFRLRLISDQGYAPNFSVCAKCASRVHDRSFFSVVEGLLVCDNCVFSIRMPISMSKESVALLQSVQKELPNMWNISQNFSTARAQQKECTQVINAFVQYHLGIVWEKGRFQKR